MTAGRYHGATYEILQRTPAGPPLAHIPSAEPAECGWTLCGLDLRFSFNRDRKGERICMKCEHRARKLETTQPRSK